MESESVFALTKTAVQTNTSTTTPILAIAAASQWFVTLVTSSTMSSVSATALRSQQRNLVVQATSGALKTASANAEHLSIF